MTSLSTFLYSIGIAPADLGFFACVVVALYLGAIVKEMRLEWKRQKYLKALWRGEKVR